MEAYDKSHYTKGRKYETWDVIADWGLDYFCGNAIKYISRAGRKDGNSEAQDLVKAIDYLQKKLDNLGYGRNRPVIGIAHSSCPKTLEEAYEQQYKYDGKGYDPT